MFDATIQILVRRAGRATADSDCMQVPVSLALGVVRADREIARNTQVHRAVDRDGHGVRVFYTQLAGPWPGVEDITHIVTVPTAAA
ncbi:hypothetical protein ACFU5Y_16325 [Streptomyces gardneri]|uniref:hypothetical protein n=1 Tax=Streptomyces gardneri TaxID=66892 RepID=UPI0036B4721C